MQVVYSRCCGLDVHKKTVVACVLTPDAHGRPEKEIRTFGTHTADLLKLADWLTECEVSHVAMESTGVYWKPIWNILEGKFSLLLVNAQQIKKVPGRKTDVGDSEWLAQLLQHGLVQSSFVPDRAQRELRELTRYRASLIEERSAEVNRLQKTLEGANIKLASVASNVVGVSARLMLAALLEGQTDPRTIAELAKGPLRNKIPELEQALIGRFGPHQRFMLAQQLAHIDTLDEILARIDAEIAERMRPFEPTVERLDTIPGVGRRLAEVILAEIGTDMTRFPTDGHLASWACMCPGNEESAGKRKRSKTRQGNRWLRAALVQAAHAAGRKKDTYLQAQYRRLSARRGKKKAAVAVGHSILVIVYHMITEGTSYQDLGSNYFDQRNPQPVQRRLVRRLQELGYKVTLEPITLAA